MVKWNSLRKRNWKLKVLMMTERGNLQIPEWMMFVLRDASVIEFRGRLGVIGNLLNEKYPELVAKYRRKDDGLVG